MSVQGSGPSRGCHCSRPDFDPHRRLSGISSVASGCARLAYTRRKPYNHRTARKVAAPGPPSRSWPADRTTAAGVTTRPRDQGLRRQVESTCAPVEAMVGSRQDRQPAGSISRTHELRDRDGFGSNSTGFPGSAL